jgi:hypothetical protein
MTNWYRFICVFDLCLHVFVSENINKVRSSKILQYDTFLYIHVPVYVWDDNQLYEPF